MQSTELFKSKVALITGGGSGLGTAICYSLAEAGATIVVADVRSDTAEKVASKLRAEGSEAMSVVLDVSDENSAAQAIKQVTDKYGKIDFLVNCAGTDLTVPIEELSVKDWHRIIGVNLDGPFIMSKLAFEVMKKQGGGHVINIVSTAAKRAWANASVYHASKWGLLGLSHALHVEGRAQNIKVTAIISGGMRTPFILERFPDTPLENLQDPRNVADTIRYVLSQPAETVIPEVTVIPMRETSWP